jgi:hypothetical protein
VSLEWLNNRIPLDIERYLEASRARCFICALRDGEPGFDHHVIVDSPEAIAFLAKYPAVYGHVLVAPREHREAVIADFTEGGVPTAPAHGSPRRRSRGECPSLRTALRIVLGKPDGERARPLAYRSVSPRTPI